MTKREALLLTAAAALGAVLAGLTEWGMVLRAGLGLIDGIGDGLRALSGLGYAGNLAAWAICLAAAGLPLGWLWYQRRRRRLYWEDALLLLAAQLLYSLYRLANRAALIGQETLELTGVWALAAGGALFATLAGYAVLRLLRRLEKEAGLSRLFRGLLTGAAALLVFLAVWGALSGFLAQAAAVTAGNTGDPAGAARTNGVGAVLTLLGLTPSFLGAAVLLWGARLARALEREPFGAETVELCRITAERCRRTAQCAILLCVGGNLLQLLLLPQLRKVSFTMTLPLVSVALSAALFLLCRYFQQGKAIHDDNQSII